MMLVQEMKAFKAHYALREAFNNKKMVGVRAKMAKNKKPEAEGETA